MRVRGQTHFRAMPLLRTVWEFVVSGSERGGTGDNSFGAGNMSAPRLVEVRQKVLTKNDAVARVLRERFQEAGVCVISLVSSPGSGKTAFLERILSLMRPDFRVAALVGDLATDNDAARLARSQVPVKQICTGTVCHLDASMVSAALEDWHLNELDYLFIENVGNLVCPSSYDLGENATRCASVRHRG